MFKPSVRILAGFALALQASSAMAFFDVEMLAGKRWYELAGDYDVHAVSQEIEVAAHVDPIPVVPIAFGVSVAMGTLDKDAFGAGTTKATVFEAGLDIMAWVPMVPFITPYARLKYPVQGTAIIEGETTVGDETVKTVFTNKLSGPHIGVGAKWSPLPVLKFLFEVQKGMQTAALDTYKQDGAAVDIDIKGSANSNAALFGVEIGL